MIDNNMIKYASNPRGFTLKRWFSQLLGLKYQPHDNVVERVGMALVTEGDMKDFGSLMSAVYEAGYMKALDDYRHQVEQLGIKVKILPNAQEKSGDADDGVPLNI